jgi:cytochrome c-type biogenesis protein CcmH/NrfG
MPDTAPEEHAAAADGGRPEPRFLRWVSCAVIVLAGIVAFSNSLNNDFVFDSEVRIVTRKDNIDQLWPPSVFLPLRGRTVTDITLAMNYAIGGHETRGYHVVNLAIHLAAALVLFDLLRRAARLAAPTVPPGRTTSLALAVALLWVVHPLQTESVTYVIQRAESLMGFFYLATLDAALLSAVAVRRRGRVGWGAVAVIACTLGMGAKAIVITAPALVLVLDRLLVGASWREVFRRRGVLHAALWATLAVIVINGQLRGVVAPVNLNRTEVGFGIPEVTPFGYALSQPGVLVHYLRLVAWPDVLCLDYDWPTARTFGDVAVPGLVMLALLAATGIALRRGHWIGGAGAAFFLILAPTSTIVPIKDLAVEHRMYLPLAPVLLVIVWLAWRILGVTVGRRSPRARAVTAAALLAAATVALTARTLDRNRDYASDLAMWRSVVKIRPQNMRGQYNLGVCYVQLGRWDEAIEPLRIATEGMPDHFRSRMSLAEALRRTGEPAQAMTPIREALQLHPGDPRPIVLLARALIDLGRLDDALVALDQAVVYARQFQASPDENVAQGGRESLREALVERGRTLGRVGRWREAARDFRAALALGEDEATRGLLDEAETRAGGTAP